MDTHADRIDRYTKDLFKRMAASRERQATRPFSGAANPYAAKSACDPNCPICGGSGWIHRKPDADWDDPDFGKLDPCPKVDPFKLVDGHAGISETQRDLDWNALLDKDNVKDGINAISKVLDRGYGWVFLWGGFGLAKTVMLKIAVAKSIRAFKPASYTRMADILEDLRTAYDANNPSSEAKRRLEFWSTVPVLSIDEFDRVRSTEYADEKRFALMDARYDRAASEKKGITIMAANADPSKFDGYLADRIADKRFEIVHLVGLSGRQLLRD